MFSPFFSTRSIIPPSVSNLTVTVQCFVLEALYFPNNSLVYIVKQCDSNISYFVTNIYISVSFNNLIHGIYSVNNSYYTRERKDLQFLACLLSALLRCQNLQGTKHSYVLTPRIAKKSFAVIPQIFSPASIYKSL